ncbi:flagellar assembly protein FliH [Alkalilimnicola sp. S0819]|uniref:flagellar assembly protein FliH n=1 Tax=Alkalilimnicola sp. S0819 TaxID=2613922 RepID=UPI00186A5B43|nr:flagellar assembly protein FliH [Alkalilimnicola sp. S0819]
MEKIIRAEDDATERFDRWRPQELGEHAAKVRQNTTVEALEELHRSVYEEAYREGHAKGLEDARREGREQGLAEGRKQGEQESKAFAARIGQIVNTLADPLAELDEEVETQLLQLCLSLSKQIIRREIHTQPGEILAVIREAVGLLPMSERRVQIHLHPDDASFVRESLGELEGSKWDLLEDPLISRGGCKVSTEVSRVDATLEHRLAVLAQELLGGAREQDNDNPEEPA